MSLCIKSCFLGFIRDPKHTKHAQRQEDDYGEACNPYKDYNDFDDGRCKANDPLTLLFTIVCIGPIAKAAHEAVVIIETLSPIEETSSEHAPSTTSSVNSESIYRVINFQCLQERRCSNKAESPDDADKIRRPAVHICAASSDGNKATENAVAHCSNVITPQNDQFENEHSK